MSKLRIVNPSVASPLTAKEEKGVEKITGIVQQAIQSKIQENYRMLMQHSNPKMIQR